MPETDLETGEACAHDWKLVELVVHVGKLDALSECVKCGTPGFMAGQGNNPKRPPLSKIRWTRPELDESG